MSEGESAHIPQSPSDRGDPFHNAAHPHPHHGHGPISPVSPTRHAGLKTFLIPSPLPTRRSRTVSQSQRAAEGPQFKGHVAEFCRNKGHGFITPDDPREREIQDRLFVHISDIDGDFVPKAGDPVEYKKCLIPPKNEKYSAVHLQIASNVNHDRWDSPVPPHSPSK